MSTLYVVATPIGNLSDMSPRAVETLKNVGLIAAEDTRVTMKLTAHFDIHTPLVSCRSHREHRGDQQIKRRKKGQRIELFTVRQPTERTVGVGAEMGVENRPQGHGNEQNGGKNKY